MSKRILRIMRVWAIALGTIAFVPPATAGAQFGGLVKRAVKKAAGDAAVDAAAGQASKKINANASASANAALGAELTADTLDLVLEGLSATSAKLEQVEALSKRRDDATFKLQEHRTTTYAVVERYNEQQSRISACIHDYLNGVSKARENELRAKMMNAMATPGAQNGIAAEYAKTTQEMSQAQLEGDTIAVNRALADFYKKALGIDVHADSVAAQKQCGSLPRKPSAIVEQERIEAQVDSMNVAVRGAEAQASTAGESASGLSLERFVQARERLTTWLRADKEGKTGNYFSDRENRLLASRKSDIQRVDRALR
jgi:hypothetical protein